MNTRQALKASLRVVPTLDTVIATQRQQLRDQLHIADGARALEDWELWARSARNVADVARALEDNLEQQTMSRATVLESSTEALVAELRKRAAAGEKDAAAALRAPAKAKEAARGRS